LHNIIFKHNINRYLDDNNKIVFEPQIEFSFVPKKSQRFTISYTENIGLISAKDLISGMLVSDYNNYTSGSNVENIYSVKHRISSLFVIVNQFRNIQFVANISYEIIKNSTTKDYYRTGMTNKTKTVSTPQRHTLFFISSFSKKFLFAPINMKLDINYQQNKYSYLIAGNEIKYQNYSPSLNIELGSSYKQGFNGAVYANFLHSYYKTTILNKQYIQRYTGKISFTKNKFYTSTSIGYESNNVSKIMQHFYYWDANIRYSFNEKYELELIGNDILHLSDKRWQEISQIDNVMIESYVRRISGYIILKFNIKI
jgi:hypothetical protein